MQRFAIDWKASVRTWRRSPSLAVVAVLALALGIGATTTMFSIVHGATRDLPFDEPHELTLVTQSRPREGITDMGARTFDVIEWRAGLRSFAGLAAFRSEAVNVSDDAARPERVAGAAITPNAFPLLGETPLLGRALLSDDAREGAPAVVVLAHELWRNRYGADSGIVGRTIRLDGRVRTVVGVMRPGFAFPLQNRLWTPLVIPAAASPEGADWVRAFGRLRDGVSLAEARAELDVMTARLAAAHPATHRPLRATIFPFAESELPPENRTMLRVMLVAVSFLLVIACANVANALLARAASRMGEISVRTALGASRARIAGQHMMESMTLAIAGGSLGLLLAWFSVRFFAASVSNIIEAFWMSFRLDVTVLAWASGATLLAALAAGLLPALRTASADPAEALRAHAADRSRLRLGRISRALVAIEFALAGGLLVVSATFVRAAIGIRAVPFPFDIEHVATAQLAVPWEVLRDTSRRNILVRQLAAGLGAVPGVTASGIVTTLPGRGAGADGFSLDGVELPPERQPSTGFTSVTPEFFGLTGARVIAGRLLAWSDDAGAPPVLVVNESFVRRHSPDRDPVGRQIRFGRTTYTIVGVVPDLMMQDVDSRIADGVYASLLQSGPSPLRLVARSAGDPESLLPALRALVERVDASLPLMEPMPLRAAIYADKKILDVFAILFFAFGLGALFMTTIGLYGVISFAVQRRTREIAIRQALGATPRAVLGLVMRQGALELSVGIGIGLLLAVTLSRLLAAVIDREIVQPAGPGTLAAIAGMLACTALVALWRPARRALGLQPIEGLRAE
jgi:predicted permease